MQKSLPLLVLCLCFSLCGHSQFSRYIIKFKDKGTNPYSISNPLQYLTQRSIDRRARYNIPIDSTDLPITPRYIDSVRLAGNVTIINVSKWLNQVAIQTTDAAALTKINSFPFVISTSPLAAKNAGSSPVNKQLDPPQIVQASAADCTFPADLYLLAAQNGKNGKINYRVNDSIRADFDLPNQLKLDYGNDSSSVSDLSARARKLYSQITDNAKKQHYNTNTLKSDNAEMSRLLKLGYLPAGPTYPLAVPKMNFNHARTGFYNYGLSDGQIKIHNGDFLHNHGFRGEGMQMAILDAGFFHYLSLPTFDSVRANNQVLGTWDFVANEASVDEDFLHGMQCFSTIAANMPGTFVGTAPKTSFYLYRTEDIGSEYPIEEQNWAAGIERADSLGIDISSTSLGYTTFDNATLSHTYADMDGNTTICAKAANLASKKGILVVCAAGNEATNTWHYVVTPGDADSALCVGAVDVAGNVAGFTSFGPSSDGDIRPSVAAVGANAVVANPSNGQPSFNSGTSFATPNMAGMATCLWQAFPEISNMGIIHTLEASATRSNNPDDRIGYGIPDVKKAFVMLQKQTYTKQSVLDGCSWNLQFNIKTDNTMVIEVGRKGPNEADYSILSSNLTSTQPYGLHLFSFSDQLDGLVLGNYQYRLKMIIGTDTSYYLDSMTLNYAASCAVPSENSVHVGPNPVRDQLNVIIARTNDSKVDVVIRNSIGQKVYRNSFQQQAGIQTTSIPMQGFSKGVYFLTVYINNKKETTKKIVRQ